MYKDEKIFEWMLQAFELVWSTNCIKTQLVYTVCTQTMSFSSGGHHGIYNVLENCQLCQ